MKSIWWLVAVLVTVAAAGCAMVRSKESGAWVGQPVEAVETHAYFRTLPMMKMYTSAGVEVRNYQSRANTHQCYTDGDVKPGQALSQSGYGQVMTCTSLSAGCDYVFSIRDGKVVDYAPGGRVLDASACAAAAAGVRSKVMP